MRAYLPEGRFSPLKRRIGPWGLIYPQLFSYGYKMSTHRLNLHLVSDATGETLNSIVRATTVQFEHLTILPHRWSLIRTRFQLHRVIDGLQAEPGPVLSSLVDKGLRSDLDMACHKLGVPVVHVLDQVMTMLQDHLGEQAAARPGRQYTLDADYFRRIDAIHYVLAHDDGQAQAGIAGADVVLVGVSRSSKTPSSFYLANRGIKAGNIPLVPGIALPTVLETPNCPVVGLTLDPQALIDIRRHRLKMLGTENVGPQHDGQYTDQEAVTAELLWAKRLCTSRGWPLIDVSRRSIEETAATVIQLIDAWHDRRNRAAAAKNAAPAAPA
jgi:[pyruvate, water dikinase]-phosphate phosphotransferase / [pyruvate, water dikinase] kinase